MTGQVAGQVAGHVGMRIWLCSCSTSVHVFDRDVFDRDVFVRVRSILKSMAWVCFGLEINSN